LFIVIATEADNIPKTSVTPNGQELHSHHSTGMQWTYQTIYNKTYCTYTQRNKQFPT